MAWQLILGPILGLVGSGVEKFAEHKQEQLKAEERAKERSHDLLMMDKEAELAVRRMTVEGAIRQDETAAKAFADSYQFANDRLIPEGATMTAGQLNWVVGVEVLSKSIRPVATIWYQILIAVIFGWSAWKITGAGVELFTVGEMSAMFREVVYSIIGMGETVLFWWFGVRRMSKKQGVV